MTSDRAPIQTELFWVFGPPEGRDYAKAGSVEVDVTTGIWWWKSTNETLNTGWRQFATGGGGGGGSQINYVYWLDTGPTPPSPPPLPTEVWTVLFRDGSPTVHWDPDPSVLAWK